MSKEADAENKRIAELDAIKKNNPYKPGSEAFETFLAAGYPDIGSKENALELIERRKKNPADVPYDVVKRAEAFLAALDARPTEKDIYHPPTDSQGRVIVTKSRAARMSRDAD